MKPMPQRPTKPAERPIGLLIALLGCTLPLDARGQPPHGVQTGSGTMFRQHEAQGAAQPHGRSHLTPPTASPHIAAEKPRPTAPTNMSTEKPRPGNKTPLQRTNNRGPVRRILQPLRLPMKTAARWSKAIATMPLALLRRSLTAVNQAIKFCADKTGVYQLLKRAKEEERTLLQRRMPPAPLPQTS